MSNSSISLSDINYGLVMHEEPPKRSAYMDAGAPLICFLPSCKKPFESSCYRGDDKHYYYSETSAPEGSEEDREWCNRSENEDVKLTNTMAMEPGV